MLMMLENVKREWCTYCSVLDQSPGANVKSVEVDLFLFVWVLRFCSKVPTGTI